MKTQLTSACRHCRYYTPEGRRGGVCAMLSVSVQSQWKACALAVSPFGSYWENIEEIGLWQEQTVTLTEAAVTVSERNACQLTGSALTEKTPAVSV
ncbi:hypothetical protein [Microcoleus sp. LEGE 07076]|uniref:hypothetical protein n=1 Tax=Microcoleus sp. LEGE 07076 TaxID=915322 RepID=UPI001D14E757|nr:hypothetical protein [Microcoleus sp. LEGE 07076]